MGMFEVNVRVANLASPGRTEEVSLLVDKGATLSWITRATLERLGVRPISRLPFLRPNGCSIEREVTGVLLTIGGRTAGVSGAFAERGEKPVLGLTAIEAMGFAVDLVKRKLVPRDLRQLSLTAMSASNDLEQTSFAICK